MKRMSAIQKVAQTRLADQTIMFCPPASFGPHPPTHLLTYLADFPATSPPTRTQLKPSHFPNPLALQFEKGGEHVNLKTKRGFKKGKGLANG